MAYAHLELNRTTNRLTGRLNFKRGYVPLLLTSTGCRSQFALLLFRSALGESFSVTPMVLTVRGFLDDIKCMMIGDFYMGRGCRQRGFGRSEYCNDFKVAVHGRDAAISRFAEKLASVHGLRSRFWRLSGLRLVCHCRPSQACHGDAIIREFTSMYPEPFNRAELDGMVPSSSVLNYVSRLRDEPECEEESSADEGVPQKGSGWHGDGEPTLVGVGYVSREFCNGQALASPGRWPVAQRRYPDDIFVACTGDQIHGFLQQVWSSRTVDETGIGACGFVSL